MLAAVLVLAGCGTPSQPVENAANANTNVPNAYVPDTQAPVQKTGMPAADFARAETLFNDTCARCHLTSGKGEAEHKKDDIPDFTNPQWQAREDNDEIREAIENGKGKIMPAFKNKLSSEQIDLLVSYVRTFPQHSSSGQMPHDGMMENGNTMHHDGMMENGNHMRH